jgi:hypothetical protein
MPLTQDYSNETIYLYEDKQAARAVILDLLLTMVDQTQTLLYLKKSDAENK